MDPEEAVIDFKQRRENYMRVYETVAEADGSYIKIINSKQFIGTFGGGASRETYSLYPLVHP
jgi:hypothetical protein